MSGETNKQAKKKTSSVTQTRNLKRLLDELELIVMLKRSLAYTAMQIP